MGEPLRERGYVRVEEIEELVRGVGRLMRGIGRLREPMGELPGRAERCLAELGRRGIGLTPEQAECVEAVFEPQNRLVEAFGGLRREIGGVVKTINGIVVRVGGETVALKRYPGY